MKQWYQVKEQSAGEKRLLFTWYLYKLFGKGALNAVTFIVTFFTFIFAKEIRGYSKKYLSVIEPYTGLKPSLINQFRHFLSYSFTLADRVEIFSNNFDKNKLKFSTPAVKDEIYSYFEKDKKAFFLCSHVGNTEVMRTMFINNTENPNINVNIFLSKNQCKIFNGFIKK